MLFVLGFSLDLLMTENDYDHRLATIAINIIIPAILTITTCWLMIWATRYIWRRARTHTTNIIQLTLSPFTTNNILYVCTTCCEGKRDPPLMDKTTIKEETNNKGMLPTGPQLFRKIVSHLTGLAPEMVNLEESYTWSSPQETKTSHSTKSSLPTLIIKPQKCLGACKQANSVALCHPHKYSYHFTRLDSSTDDNDSGIQDLEDLVGFVRRYVNQSDKMFTKKADRPGKLATNCISRLPPSITLDEKNVEIVTS